MPDPALLTRLRLMLPPGCGAAWTNPLADHPLSDTEAPARAAPARLREFAAGRAAARQAMAEIGEAAAPIPAGADRAPQWPPGIVGSITHSRSACLAAVMRAPPGAGIGIDLEEATPLDRPLWDTILLPHEQRVLLSWPPEVRAMMAKVAFSAKEAAYKAQYPTSRTLFGFDVMTVTLAGPPQGGQFDARFEQPIPPFAAGHRISGHYALCDDHILTVATL
jgi:4'-phosphopantetheinyl transferase EntD